ncbi:hypothetical protein SARC_07074 [Sphaeroforma arctica JP610]|uniref:Vps16 C-terminal domain-containing protein n=1 Tax=Sphaeroforma arctica JP610 TaxID=667725 RepID=A0A0L0FUR8_9EUKA|nr:hypothetical protein SARC_07074 [Sphaeroforma arctica JP610]KNC80575.1 hypothetical protein SARC_07074 [Sphaeroforma arctica JP610]|eukprot:XP_014154477.1 hypothetical protein SARC_07074 [Sphaeroforma arctica JP610]
MILHHRTDRIENVSDRHYTWISVEARAQLQDWEAIKGMFQAKPTALGIFASKKTATVDIPIGIENLIDVLHRHQAPLTVIRKFYSAIQDKQARYLAVVAGEQVDDAIDTWAEMRDMSALKQYLVDIEGGKLGLNSRDITIYGDRIRRII